MLFPSAILSSPHSQIRYHKYLHQFIFASVRVLTLYSTRSVLSYISLQICSSKPVALNCLLSEGKKLPATTCNIALQFITERAIFERLDIMSKKRPSDLHPQHSVQLLKNL